jgi:hypothetical protein
VCSCRMGTNVTTLNQTPAAVRPVGVAKARAILRASFRGSDGELNTTLFRRWYLASINREEPLPPPPAPTPQPTTSGSHKSHSRQTLAIVLGVVIPLVALISLLALGARWWARQSIGHKRTWRAAPGPGMVCLLVSDIEGSTQASGHRAEPFAGQVMLRAQSDTCVC